MRHQIAAATIVTLAFTAAAPAPARAQSRDLPTQAPANPQGKVPDQRLEVADQNMVYAAERLDTAARQGNDKVLSEALEQSRITVQQIRTIFKDLPQDQRAPYEDALARAEQALAQRDPAAGAAAMRALRERVLSLTAGRT